MPDSETWTTNSIRYGEASVLAERSKVPAMPKVKWAEFRARAQSRSREDIFPALLQNCEVNFSYSIDTLVEDLCCGLQDTYTA